MKDAQLDSRLLLFVTLLGLAGWNPLVHGADTLPTADEVIHKAVERPKWVEEQKFEGNHAFTQLSVKEEFDDHKVVKDREELLYHVYPVEGLPYAELVQKDGKPPTAQDLKKERDRQKKLRERWARQGRHKDDEEVSFDEELVGRYRFEMVRRESIDGRTTFLLRFEPRSDDLPARRKVDRVLNKLEGSLWIDESDHDIAKVEFRLRENVTTGWGLLAVFRRLDVSFEQARGTDGVWLPCWIDAYVDGRVLIKSFHVRQHEQMSDIRKTSAEGQNVTPATKLDRRRAEPAPARRGRSTEGKRFEFSSRLP